MDKLAPGSLPTCNIDDLIWLMLGIQIPDHAWYSCSINCEGKMLFKTSFIFFQMRFFRLLQEGLIQWPFVGSDMILNVKDLFTRIVIHGLFKI